jgi:hypothetical protein
MTRPNKPSASLWSPTPWCSGVVQWNTVYLQDALDAMAQSGRPVDDDAITHLSPAQSDHINPYGNYTFDIERELTRTVRRPLNPKVRLRA